MQTDTYLQKTHTSRSAPLGCRILVVDVDLEQADNAVLMLERFGHRVTRTYRASSAFELAKEFRPAIVLVDLTRRPILGFAAATAIRRISQQVYLVAMTTLGDSKQHVSVRGIGFDAELVKPIRELALEQMLYQWCSKMRKRQTSDDSAV